jgi:hypothetical protein
VQPAPFRKISRDFHPHIDCSGKPNRTLSVVAGFPFETTLPNILRLRLIVATPLAIQRLERVAHAIGFPKDELFVDGDR